MAQRIGDLYGGVDGEVRSGAGDPGYCQRKIIAQVRLIPCLVFRGPGGIDFTERVPVAVAGKRAGMCRGQLVRRVVSIRGHAKRSPAPGRCWR